MKISNNWLQDYLKTDLSIDETSDLLTDIGLEVEGVENHESIKGGLVGIVIGKILTVEKHPDADRLNLTTVDVGEGDPLQIVCGAPNGKLPPFDNVNCVLKIFPRMAASPSTTSSSYHKKEE